MDLQYILLVVVYSPGGLFCLSESLLEGEGEEIGFEVEFEGSSLDVEFAGGDFDIGEADEDGQEAVVLLQLELGNDHRACCGYYSNY
jgi:hypothetical protein